MAPARRRALRAVVGACALVGCDVPAPVAPEISPRLVVFSILDPGASEHVILLMQTRASVPDTALATDARMHLEAMLRRAGVQQ